MTPPESARRAQGALAVLERNREEVRTLIAAQGPGAGTADAAAFPRSRTLRWLMQSSLGRWAGVQLLAMLLKRLPLRALLNGARGARGP